MRLRKNSYANLKSIIDQLDSVSKMTQDLAYLEVTFDKEKIQELIKIKDKILEADPEQKKEFVEKSSDSIAHLKELVNKTFSNLTPYQRFKLSRHPNRPKTIDYIGGIFDDFTEICGEDEISSDPSVVGGIAKLDKIDVMVIGQEKGAIGQDAYYREDGVTKPAGYRKSQRLMEIAEKLNLPVVTFLDTPGANPLKESLAGQNIAISINGKKVILGNSEKELEIKVNERYIRMRIKADDLLSDIQGQTISQSIRKMGKLTVPSIAVVIGEGGSGGAVGIGAADRMIVLSNSYYSVISPEGACGILKKVLFGERVKLNPNNREDLEYTASNLRFSAANCLEFKIADEIVDEPFLGAQSDPKIVYKAVREAILRNLKILEKKSFEDRREVIKRRLEKYRAVARFMERKDTKEFLKRFKKEFPIFGKEARKWVVCQNHEKEGCKDFHPRTFYIKYKGVCPNCNYHLKMPLEFYIDYILDRNSFKEFNSEITSINAIGFDGFDTLLEEARKKAGTNCALVSGTAKIGKYEIIAIMSQNDFRGGSFGSAESEKIVRAVEKALEYKKEGKILPVVMFNRGGGIRIQEGPIGVAQMVTASQACSLLEEEGIPLISVLLDPTMAGILASYAGTADYIIAEKNAMIGFAGEDVIKKTIGETVSKEFRYAEEAQKRGFVDEVVHRHDLKKTLENILGLYKNKKFK